MLEGEEIRAARHQPTPFLVLEDGKPLDYSLSSHKAIRELGHGRTSIRGESIRFSSSDGTPPDKNGRTYRVVLPRSI